MGIFYFGLNIRQWKNAIFLLSSLGGQRIRQSFAEEHFF